MIRWIAVSFPWYTADESSGSLASCACGLVLFSLVHVCSMSGNKVDRPKENIYGSRILAFSALPRLLASLTSAVMEDG